MPATARGLGTDGVDADVEQYGIDAELILDDRHQQRMLDEARERRVLVDQIEDPLRASAVEHRRDVDEADADLVVGHRPRRVELGRLLQRQSLGEPEALVVVEFPDAGVPRLPLGVGQRHIAAWIERMGALVVEQSLDPIAQVGRRGVVEQSLDDDVAVGQQSLEHDPGIRSGIDR